MPIDLPYLGETGIHERTYEAWDVQNLSGRDILQKLAGVIGGPDMQFRPYLADSRHVRWRFLAGSDADVYLGQDTVHVLSYARGQHSSIEDLRIDYLGPEHRIYATGSGSDKAQMTHMVEDLSLVRQMDPWPLREAAWSDTDADNWPLLRDHAAAQLAAAGRPLMQISGSMHVDALGAGDRPLHPLGSMWPGERVDLDIQGFPTLEDGTYECRLMQMSGDQSDRVDLVFDVMANPYY